MNILKCKRCAHEWQSRKENPKACPRCKSYFWHKAVTRLLLMAIAFMPFIACQKKPDPPAPQIVSTSNPQPLPPAVSICQGATIPVSIPVVTQNTGTTITYAIPNFELSCGDTVAVYIKNIQLAPTDPWTTLLNDPAGSSYYSILNQTVTVHNNTGNTVYVDIEAVLK